MDNEPTITVETTINASVEKLWKLWTTSNNIMEWNNPSQAVNSIHTASAHAELWLPDGRRLLFHQAVTSDYLKALID